MAEDGELRVVTMGRSGRRHLAERSASRALCGRRGAMKDAGDGEAGLSCRICEGAVQQRGRKGRKTAIAFHAFRHTCASLLFAEGRNVKQVSEWLGHTDPAFTLRSTSTYWTTVSAPDSNYPPPAKTRMAALAWRQIRQVNVVLT